MSKIIRLRRRRTVDFINNQQDRLVEQMTMLGFGAKFIADTCRLSSPSLVYYRNRKANLRIRDFREGTSQMAVVVLQRMRSQLGPILDQHLERQEDGARQLKVRGVRIQPKTYIRRELLAV